MSKIKLSDIHEFVLENAKCNFHCAYCHSGYSEGENNHCSRPVVFNKEWIEENMEMNHSPKMNLWGGEPFVNWETYKEVIEYFKPYVDNMSFICNGSLFDEDKAKYLVSKKVSIHFSHDLSDQSIRGIDFLKTDKFKKAFYIFKSFKSNWKVRLRKTYHGESSSFESDYNYLKEIRTNFIPDINFRIMIAFGRGFEENSDFIWKAENLLQYHRDAIEKAVSGDSFAKSFTNELVKRGLVIMNLTENPSEGRHLCPATRAYENGIPFAIGSTGHQGHCHCYMEYPRGLGLREECKVCSRKGYCMGACYVTNNTAQCKEWAKLYDGIAAITREYVDKLGIENFKNLTSFEVNK